MTEDNDWPVTLYEWETTVKVPISVRRMAEIFANMDDDKQAQFFVYAAEVFAGWGHYKAEVQAMYIGGHLRNCKCSTEAAREFVRSIAYGLENSTHGQEEKK